jgi:nucleotide-binding universal stress UspA family protein
MYQRILVPVDGSPTSEAGLGEAIKLARLTGAQLRLLHLVDQLPVALSIEGLAAQSVDVLGLLRQAGQDVLDRAKARVQAESIVVDCVLIDFAGGSLFEVVMKQVIAWQADLIVIGTHGRRGIGRMLMGSDAEQVVRHATIPVLLYRAVVLPDAT